MHTLGSRSFLWFLTGVALTITTIALFGPWRADADVTPGESAFVSVTPCRLLDTRPAFQVGPRGLPLAANRPYTQQVTGANGDCDIPAGATAVSMNVTIASPTAASFLTLYPSDAAEVPTASNLNYVAGQAPTPNKVDVKLSASGQVDLLNRFGTVDVIADVVGYYTADGIAGIADEIDALTARLTAAESAIGDNRDDVAAARTDIDALLSDSNVIASGTTVSGTTSFTQAITLNETQFAVTVVGLPGRAPTALTDDMVNGAAGTGFFDEDASCTGSHTTPTAPAGKVCIYPIPGVENQDNVNLGLGSGGATAVLADRSFTVAIASSTRDGGEVLLFGFAWAYTAP